MAIQSQSVSKGKLVTGRVITILAILFFLFDCSLKILRLQAAVDGTIRAGYPASLIQPIGIALLVCTILYMIPRTSILGAILLTGYLGGATATMARVQDPLFLLPVGFGVFAWAGLFLREPRLRALVPLRSQETVSPMHEQKKAA